MRFLVCLGVAAFLLSSSALYGRQIALTVENDSLTWTGQDVHYTSGIAYSVSYPATANTWVQQGFDWFKSSSLFGTTIATDWTIGQQIFTPEIISIKQNQPHERPWAGFTYGQISRLGQTDHRYDQLAVVLGVVGPESLGEDIQKKLHTHIGFHRPLGWDNQLHNEIAGYVSWQRSWPHFWKHYAKHNTFSAGPYIGTALGTLYRYGSVGVTVRYSPIKQGMFPIPQRLGYSHPTLFGLPVERPHTQERQWQWFGAAECRTIEHNLFLDGNTSQASNSIEKKPIVVDISAGFITLKKKKQWAYTFIFRSKEFKGQHRDDIFAVISLLL